MTNDLRERLMKLFLAFDQRSAVFFFNKKKCDLTLSRINQILQVSVREKDQGELDVFFFKPSDQIAISVDWIDPLENKDKKRCFT